MAANLFEIARRYAIEVLEEANLDVLRRLVSETFVRRGPMGEVSGRAAFEEQVFDDRFSDIAIAIDDVIAANDQAVIQYTWRATHRGELFGIAPTGRPLRMNACEVINVERGKIVESTVYFDVYALFEQLGMLPRPYQLAPPQIPRPVLRLVR
jgi:predicted ester cyclase